ncbi:carbohydrate ABC transporter permease [Arthrobacter sp. 35W]|uniref:carbohydrate ABC transporter permease n=1 Tax=Arthrobacter sp. 35W TaxID=1132441 RepID=UPI0004065ACB|nr:sugar ABC transporter permease [Arthrobacter sp. 35W]
MNSVLGNKKAIVVLLGPALLVFVGVMVIPVVWSFAYSLYTGNVIRGFTFVGFDNFVRLFNDDEAHEAFFFTLKYSVVVTAAQIVLGYALALLYVFVLKKSSTFVRTMVFFPVVLPTVAVSLLFSRFFQFAPQEGPINSLLKFLGADTIDFMATGPGSFLVLVLMDLWRSQGFYAVLLYAGLIDIPDEILDSARVDGAKGGKLLRHIILPMSLPVLLSSVVFSFNSSLKVFDSVLALTRGGPGNDTTPLNLFMYKTSFLYSDYGYGSTIAILITVLCLVVTLFIFRSSRRDLTKD